MEFAVLLPLLALLLFGGTEIVKSLYAYQFVNTAADRAATFAMVRGSSCHGWTSACPANARDIQDYVRSLAPSDMDVSLLKVSTTWAPSRAPGGLVTVTVQYDFGLSMPFVRLPGLSLQGSSQAAITQ